MVRPCSKCCRWLNRCGSPMQDKNKERGIEMSTMLIAESLENLAADAALDAILSAYEGRPACMTCSFQAEDMIVLDLLRKRLPSIPVLFLETGYHFAQTYEYRDRITREWKLNLVNVAPQRTVKQQEFELGILYVA